MAAAATGSLISDRNKRDSAMSRKNAIKIGIDIALTALLPLLMAYTLVGEAAHEWLGLAMLLLFAAHHVLNIRWITGLFKGRYSAWRILNTGVNLLLAADFVFLALSSVMLSNHVFAFLPISGGMEFARKSHMLASYWGFVLMSVHAGLHLRMAVGMLKKALPEKKTGSALKWGSRIAVWLVSIYGIWAFIKREIGVYLLYRSHFVFFDFDEAVWSFLADYVAVMILFAAAGYYIGKSLQNANRRRDS